MLAGILKAIAVVFIAFVGLLAYCLCKAASKAESFEQFDEWYANQKKHGK